MGLGRSLWRALALTAEIAAIASLGYTAAAIAASAHFSRRGREGVRALRHVAVGLWKNWNLYDCRRVMGAQP